MSFFGRREAIFHQNANRQHHTKPTMHQAGKVIMWFSCVFVAMLNAYEDINSPKTTCVRELT